MRKENLIASALDRARRSVEEGRVAEGEALCAEALAANPNDVEALQILGHAAAMRRDYGAALRFLEKAANLAPRSGEVQFDLGRLLLAAERYADAEEVLRPVAKTHRDIPEPRLALAYALLKQRKHEDATAELRKLLERFPSHAEAWFNLGNVHRALGRFADAARAFRRAAALQPENPDPWINLGVTLAQDGQVDDARAVLEECLSRHPRHVDVLSNLGLVQRAAHRRAAALAGFDAALAIEPTHAGARLNRAIVLAEMGRTGEARAEAEALLERAPHDPDALFFPAPLDLAEGEFAAGWRRYGWRLARQDWLAEIGARPDAPVPPREALRGQTVRLRGEQGPGDTLFFMRFAPLLEGVARSLVLDADPRIVALVSGHPLFSAPGPESGNGVTLLVGDLPLVTSLEPMPPLRLVPDPARVASLSAALAAAGPPPYLGVTWEAGTRWTMQRQPGAAPFKRIAPDRLGSMLQAIRATPVSMQRSPRREDVASFEAALGRPLVDLSRVNDDLRDALAAVSLLDDYVGVSNTNMHLCASLGRAARVLVTQPAEWRWMKAGDASPWFPGFRLYRQATDGGWEDALARLGQDLRERWSGEPGR
ncbi:MAG TPA: tetratricopeptide repeat protein [Burkholderiales bacterium]|nr:tetratricopeptide repeat protein [Burkholderiales bacterium]